MSYIGNWNNFRDSDETRNEISALFNQLDFNLVDYYDGTAGQRCPNLGDAGTADELRGLISFMRGADYFDYNGDCNITEIRDHVQGDIYHSQLIEIGSPDGNTSSQTIIKKLIIELLIIIKTSELCILKEEMFFMLDLIVECYMQSMQKLETKSGHLFHLVAGRLPIKLINS